MIGKLSFETPLGQMTLTADSDSLVGLSWGQVRAASDDDHPETSVAGTNLLQEVRCQIEAYFSGALSQFDVPLSVRGSDFQRQVCDAMLEIPLGETRTYGDLAQRCGAPAQAIGAACGGNPIPLIIPCHRVLGANGLGGYSGQGGIETKVWFLRFEGAAGLLI